MHYIDRFYDYVIRHDFRAMVKSAGNNVAPCYYHISSPGKAYGVITVGGYNDRGNDQWGDDSMDTDSAYVNPKTDGGIYSDREKPEVVAPDINITTIGLNSTPVTGSGTSYAAPQVAAVIALMIGRSADLRVWPEASKAILMASAVHNIDGPTIPQRLDGYDDKDGAGAVDAALADTIASHVADDAEICSGPCWWKHTLDISAGMTMTRSFQVQRGQRVRAAIVWHSNPASDYSSDPLSTDLDLRVYKGTGLVASSLFVDNGYEIVDFIASEPGTYRLEVKRETGTEMDNFVGIAWTPVPDVNLPMTLRNEHWSEGYTSTSILAQNLTPRSNTVTLNFYQTNGNQTSTQKTATLGAEQSTTFDQRQASGDPGVDPFLGASALSGQDAVGAVVQMVRTGGSGGVNSYEAYNGLGETAVGTTIRAPLLMRNVSSGGKT